MRKDCNSFIELKNYSDIEEQLNLVVPELMEIYNVPGLALALINKKQSVSIMTYGFTDKNNHIPICENTLFHVASISKTLAAWGVMKLVELGKIDLDTSAERYLTRWHIPQSRFNHDDVTIRRLLNHTAGISIHGYIGYGISRNLPSLEESLKGIFGKQKKVEVSAEPGSVYSYSGGGYTILQLIIEEVTGITFQEYMKNEIFGPLKMTESTFDWYNNSKSQMVSGHGVFGKVLPNYLFVEKAACGLYTTIKDMANFVVANIEGIDINNLGKGVLRRETLQQMYSRMHRNIPYGLGYSIVTTQNGKIVSHNGRSSGCCSRFTILTDKAEGIVILTNSYSGQNLISDIMTLWLENNTVRLSEYYIKALALGKDRNGLIVSIQRIKAYLKDNI